MVWSYAETWSLIESILVVKGIVLILLDDVLFYESSSYVVYLKSWP